MTRGGAKSAGKKAVEVLCLSTDPPLISRGRLCRQQADRLEVVLEGAEREFRPGMRVVVVSESQGGPRVLGTVLETAGPKVEIETGRVIPEEKRAFPRMPGGIRLRYCALSGPEIERACRSWMAGKDDSRRKGEWREPDPFMDFSGSGLRFEDERPCRVGDVLLLEFQVPGTPEIWRATARVVRVEEVARREDAADGGAERAAPAYAIAVHFTDLPVAAREALGAFTLRIQNALLGIA